MGEILPPGIDDQKQVAGLLANKESLIREFQQIKKSEQTELEFIVIKNNLIEINNGKNK